MFGSEVPARFTREYGCTLPDWARDLPGAVGAQPLELPEPGQARVRLGPPGAPGSDGSLHLQWQVLPPRQIALVRLPRLQVDFVFDAVSPEARAGFMRRFDLFMQRGGG